MRANGVKFGLRPDHAPVRSPTKKRPAWGAFCKDENAAGSGLGVVLLGGLDLDADVLGNALDVLEDLARPRSGGFVPALELLELFLQVADLVLEGLDVAHGYSL